MMKKFGLISSVAAFTLASRQCGKTNLMERMLKKFCSADHTGETYRKAMGIELQEPEFIRVEDFRRIRQLTFEYQLWKKKFEKLSPKSFEIDRELLKELSADFMNPPTMTVAIKDNSVKDFDDITFEELHARLHYGIDWGAPEKDKTAITFCDGRRIFL